MSGLVDTHAHLMDHAFAEDRQAVLQRARTAGLDGLVLVGYDLASSRTAIELARPLPWSLAAVGIHPNSVSAASAEDFDQIARLAQDSLVAAIGETGLDYFRDRTPPERQRQAFEWHLQLAEQRKLPVVVHTRDAHADVADMLERSAARRPSEQIPGILHCYTSAPGFAARMLDAGYYLSFAGPLTYKSSGDMQRDAAAAPANRLLVETDCPYLPPSGHRGQRNEPAYVAETVQFLAQLRGMSESELSEQLWDNSLRVFPALALVAQVTA